MEDACLPQILQQYVYLTFSKEPLIDQERDSPYKEKNAKNLKIAQ